jgi:lysophospholipase L1-like esterase
MIHYCKVALGPVLALQSLFVSRTALRLPEATGRRVGKVGRLKFSKPLRVLFVGDSSAAGVGVTRLRESLVVQSCRLISQRIKAPVSWQLVAKSGFNTGQAFDLVRSSPLQPADVLVTSLGVNDVTDQRTLGQFLEDYQSLVEYVIRWTGVKTVVINGMPPVHTMPVMPQPLRWYLGRYAQNFDAALRAWADANENFCYVPLQIAVKPSEFAIDRYHPGAALYRRWAECIAESASAHLLMTKRPRKLIHLPPIRGTQLVPI